MGSVFTPKVSSPPPPPPPPAPSSYRDEIGGTEQVAVKNADGTYTYITQKIPLTPEEQAVEDEYNAIMKDALSEIQKLSSSDYSSSEETKKVLNAWEAEKTKFVDNSFDERAEVENKILARRGLASSSAGEAAMRRRISDKSESLEEVKREKDMIGSDIRNDKLSLQQNLYNIAASRNDIEGARTLSSAASGMGMVSSINAGNQASIADYYNRQLTSHNSRIQNTSPTMFGQVVNGVIGSPLTAGFSLFK
tara:strand:- start:161296 stop:162045 length:750 start_codon:yes stop_codon:yes gene_type:complete